MRIRCSRFSTCWSASGALLLGGLFGSLAVPATARAEPVRTPAAERAQPERPPTLGQAAPPIDREALVRRHNPSVTRVDPSAPFMVGNGNLALTADITGLATFREQYSPLAPLSMQAQWAWHSFPNPAGHRLEDSLVPVDVRGQTRYFPWLQSWAEAKKPVMAWLRENPHRFSLGRLSLHLATAKGATATFADLSQTQQTLDLWTGRLGSHFTFDGEQVDVETSVHPTLDLVIVRLRSPLIASGRLGVDLRFPGVSAALNPDPADFDHPDAHRTTELGRGPRGMALERQLDDTRYWVEVGADCTVDILAAEPHTFRITAPKADTLTLLVLFSRERKRPPLPAASAARAAVAESWRRFWTDGAALDFSGSTDPRAAELERRVVLSQYLMAVNAAGELPPQEEGLFSNSWNGKFHVEMHPWHAAFFAIWGHPERLARSMPWYERQLPMARQRARGYGARGAWWPKMVGPEGIESPSTITPFIMWQQPHPIYLAELLYRASPTRATLQRYRELVFASADLLASYPHLDPSTGRYVLGPPIIPAQEVFPPLSTFNPTFELAYYRFGLETAQRWRHRLGLAPEPTWARVLERLAPLPTRDGLYLAAESHPELWQQARSPECHPPATAPGCINRDHPSFVAALGLLPGNGVDVDTMRRTLDAVLRDWDLRQIWGWDLPMLAMTATRLHEPARAVELLLSRPAESFRFGLSGMTPRVHLDLGSAPSSPGQVAAAPSFQRDAETYFPSNGALLLAVGLMAAGWDGESTRHPGFPSDGSWRVRSEGLRPLP
jgi:hypothetical protein